MLDKTLLKVDWATYSAARYACEKWHYSGCLPTGKLVKVGVWENDIFIGVLIFSRGATPEIGSPYGMKQIEICELTRVALREHITPVSRIISIALKFLKKKSPGLKMIVSFADSAQGHYGGIYQATNWIYAGAAKTHAYMVLGKKEHPKTLHSRYGKGGQSVAWLKKNIDKNAERIFVGVKHRYLMPLDKESKDKIEHLSKPYPKRQKKHDSENPSESGRGSTDPGAPISSTEASST